MKTTEEQGAETTGPAVITTEKRILPDLPEANYEGYEFNILTRTLDNADWTQWDSQEIYAEAENGETINDAVYRRNKTIEEKYNIVIKEKRVEYISGNFAKTLKNTVMSGDGAYDVASPRTFDSKSYILDGYFEDLYTVPNIDLEKPWWNQQAKEELTLDGRLFLSYSDLLIMDNNAIYAILFNKKLIQDFGIENPYNLVRAGTWTMDAMLGMMKGTSNDINNDGEMGPDDQYGFVGHLGSVTSLYHASGERFAKKNGEGYPEFAFGSDRTFAVTEKMFEIMYDKTMSLNAHHYEGKLPIYEMTNKIFSEDRCLFYSERLISVESLRGSEVDFGILPMPKFDVSQDKYQHEVCVHTSCCIAIPRGSADVTRSGLILEALTAESKYTLQPAYYDIALTTKYSRDNESKEMLDIIFSTTVFDIGQIFNFADFANSYMELARKNNINIASLYEKSLTKIETDITKVNTKLAEITGK